VLTDGLSAPKLAAENEAALKEESRLALTEFFRWSLKQSSKRDVAMVVQKDGGNPVPVHRLLGSLEVLLAHPSEDKRAAATAMFNSLYRELREEESLIHRYALHVLYLLLQALRQQEQGTSEGGGGRSSEVARQVTAEGVRKYEEMVVRSVLHKADCGQLLEASPLRTSYPISLKELTGWVWAGLIALCRVSGEAGPGSAALAPPHVPPSNSSSSPSDKRGRGGEHARSASGAGIGVGLGSVQATLFRRSCMRCFSSFAPLVMDGASSEEDAAVRHREAGASFIGEYYAPSDEGEDGEDDDGDEEGDEGGAAKRSRSDEQGRGKGHASRQLRRRKAFSALVASIECASGGVGQNGQGPQESRFIRSSHCVAFCFPLQKQVAATHQLAVAQASCLRHLCATTDLYCWLLKMRYARPADLFCVSGRPSPATDSSSSSSSSLSSSVGVKRKQEESAAQETGAPEWSELLQVKTRLIYLYETKCFLFATTTHNSIPSQYHSVLLSTAL
jgi:hypothetical protein